MRKILGSALGLLVFMASSAMAQFCPGCVQSSAAPQNATFNLTQGATIQGVLTVGTLDTSFLNISGTLSASQLVGGGAGITGLNATQLVTGNVSSGVVSGPYPGITQVGTLSAGQWEGTAVGTQYGGTGQNFSFVSAGSMIYFDASGRMNTFLPGLDPQMILQTGTPGVTPVWTSSPAVSGINLYNLPAGRLIGQLPATVTVSSASITYVNGSSVFGDISGNAQNINGTLLQSQIAPGTWSSAYPASSVTATGVSQGVYGNASTVPQLAVHSDGRVYTASNIVIAINASQINAGSLPSDITVPTGNIENGTLNPGVKITTANVSPGFNLANEILQLNGSGQIPGLDASLLFNLTAANLVGAVPPGSVSFSTITAAIQATSGSSPWLTSGSVVYLSTPTNNVVMGSTLTVEGNAFSVGGTLLSVAGGGVSAASQSGAITLSLFNGSTGEGQLNLRGSFNNNTALFGMENANNGIVTGALAGDLSITPTNGNINIAVNDGSVKGVQILSGSGNLIAYNNVGIGTSSPGAPLDVEAQNGSQESAIFQSTIAAPCIALQGGTLCGPSGGGGGGGGSPSGPSGGVLAGTYPNPTFGPQVVLSTHVANGAIGDAQTNLSTAAIASGKFGDNRVAITTGAVSGPFTVGITSACAPGYYLDGGHWNAGQTNGGTCMQAGGAGGSAFTTFVSDNFLSQVNGSRTSFTLSQNPGIQYSTGVLVVLDGLLQSPTSDYTFTPPQTITMTTAPAANSTGFWATYSINTSTAPGVPTLSGNNIFSGVNTFSTPIGVASGGTGHSSLTANSVLVGNGTSPILSLPVMGNGGLVIGGSSGISTGTLTAGANISITNGNGSITISGTGSGGNVNTNTSNSYNTAGTNQTFGSSVTFNGGIFGNLTFSGSLGLGTVVSGTTTTFQWSTSAYPIPGVSAVAALSIDGANEPGNCFGYLSISANSPNGATYVWTSTNTMGGSITEWQSGITIGACSPGQYCLIQVGGLARIYDVDDPPNTPLAPGTAIQAASTRCMIHAGGGDSTGNHVATVNGAIQVTGSDQGLTFLVNGHQ